MALERRLSQRAAKAVALLPKALRPGRVVVNDGDVLGHGGIAPLASRAAWIGVSRRW